MLVLSRRSGEKVQIVLPEAMPAGSVIDVKLVRCSDGLARLGFTAPPEVKIIREELIEVIAKKAIELNAPAADGVPEVDTP